MNKYYSRISITLKQQRTADGLSDLYLIFVGGGCFMKQPHFI